MEFVVWFVVGDIGDWYVCCIGLCWNIMLYNELWLLYIVWYYWMIRLVIECCVKCVEDFVLMWIFCVWNFDLRYEMFFSGFCYVCFVNFVFFDIW